MEMIPFKEPACWSMQITLDRIIYFLEFKWNALNEFWVMNILTSQKVPLILGIKIVPSYNLLAAYTVFGQPPGAIICQNIVDTVEGIGRFDMSQKFQLVYYTEAEVASI